jgi:hypothetical protein
VNKGVDSSKRRNATGGQAGVADSRAQLSIELGKTNTNFMAIAEIKGLLGDGASPLRERKRVRGVAAGGRKSARVVLTWAPRAPAKGTEETC